MPKHNILLSADVPGVDEGLRSFLRRVIRAALDAEGVEAPCEVNVLVTNDAGIHRINLETRGVDAPTDVLSFECDGCGDEPGAAAGDVFELGDVIIAPDVAERQTAEFATTFEEEVSLLLVHGLLHLCGYDHVVDEEAEVMEAREAELLRAWAERGA